MEMTMGGYWNSNALVEMMKEVMANHPNLTSRGFEALNASGFAEARADLLAEHRIDEFERALAWLWEVPSRKTPNKRNGNSYHLKHVAEKWAHRYVGNGFLIAAAIWLKFPVQPMDGSVNAIVGVSASAKWPVGLRPERGAGQ